MKIGTNEWTLAVCLAIGGCDPFHGEDFSEDDGGSSETTYGSASVTSEATTGASHGDDDGASYGDTGIESCSVTIGEDGGSVSATTTSTGSTTTSGGSEDDGNATEGADAACGLELEYGPFESSYACACEEGCAFQRDGLSAASGAALIDACECICDYLGCGSSVSGGVTTNAGDDEGSATETSAGSESDDGDDTSASTTTTTGGYEDG